MQGRPSVHGYILAGGQSSRMGTDKALLSFGNSTLLGRAITALQHLTPDVTIVGRADTASPASRSIPDHVTAAGPVGGLEAALTDLAARGGTWAFFLPVDVPLLPGELLRALVDLWRADPLTRVAFPIADGSPQPVINLLHVTALPALRQSLFQDQRRLRPALEDAAAQLASAFGAPLHHVLRKPVLTIKDGRALADQAPLPWHPSPRQLHLSDHWFANANTPADLDQLRHAYAAAPVAENDLY